MPQTLESLIALAIAINIDDDSLRVWTIRQRYNGTWEVSGVIDDRIADRFSFRADVVTSTDPLGIATEMIQYGMNPVIGETIHLRTPGSRPETESAWIMTSVGIQSIAVRFAELTI